MLKSHQLMQSAHILEWALGIGGHLIVWIGIFFIATSIVGVKRFSDSISKIHATSLSDSLGTPLCYIGFFLINISQGYSSKYLLIMILCFIISPLSSHSIAKFIYESEK
ncbi:MAG: monovalent cation/H(+) antiporter subunit G [Rickettsiaceae bacterium]|nr:monovalent cation/H(+) antiporter subunit G [Rickettsiaceae bacterium]